MKPNLIALCFAPLLLAACFQDLDYEPVEFTVEGNRIVATGVIDASTQGRFEQAVAEHPGVQTLVLQTIDGSADDEANLEFARLVRERGMTTVVPSGGMVASGGTDLFLAGTTRRLEPGACVGVHSWGADDFSGRDLPRGSDEHAPYLAYYEGMGIDSAFYWFTLEAAPAETMHWMSAEEATRFGLATEDVASLSGAQVCATR